MVRSVLEPWTDRIGWSESPDVVVSDRIIAMIVSTGSIILVTSRLAMSDDDITSSCTENHWNLTPAWVAATRKDLTRALRSIDGLI